MKLRRPCGSLGTQPSLGRRLRVGTSACRRAGRVGRACARASALGHTLPSLAWPRSAFKACCSSGDASCRAQRCTTVNGVVSRVAGRGRHCGQRRRAGQCAAANAGRRPVCGAVARHALRPGASPTAAAGGRQGAPAAGAPLPSSRVSSACLLDKPRLTARPAPRRPVRREAGQGQLQDCVRAHHQRPGRPPPRPPAASDSRGARPRPLLGPPSAQVPGL